MPSDVLEISGIWNHCDGLINLKCTETFLIETRPGLQECLPEKLNCMSSECDGMSADSTEYSYCVPWQQVMDQLLPPLKQTLLAQLFTIFLGSRVASTLRIHPVLYRINRTPETWHHLITTLHPGCFC